MSSSDLMFLFELFVESLKSCTTCKKYRIRASFGDIFQLKLKDPNELAAKACAVISHWTGKRGKRKLKYRHGKTKSQTLLVPRGQTVLIASDIESLTASMMKFPIELTLFSKDDPYTLGLVEIPWTSVYTDYLRNLESNKNMPPAVSTGNYNVYDDYTSKRVAVVKLKVQLSLLQNLASQLQSTKSDNCENPARTLKIAESDSDIEPGIIKTIYSGKKRKEHKQKKKVSKTLIIEPDEEKIIFIDDQSVHEDNNSITNLESNVISDNNMISLKKESNEDLYHILVKSNDKLNNSLANLVRSQTKIDNTNLFAVTKHWSSTSIEIKERLDILNYIFGNIDGPFGNQVYCVGYFTVENNIGLGSGAITKENPETKITNENSRKVSQQAISSVESSVKSDIKKSAPSVAKNMEELKGQHTFKICGSQCKLAQKNSCFENICNLNLPEEAGHALNVRKCTNVIQCEHKKHRGVLLDPHERSIIDFTSRPLHECCLEKVEEVIGGMSGKIMHGDDPCYCTCDCTFGFVKKTTYCQICGGYELTGDDVIFTKADAPFPCPIFHKLVKAKGKVEEKKEKVRLCSDRKSVESEKEKESGSKKRKKRVIDERFKFNYGYKAPKIGHSQCLIGCAGSINPVPKHMGWLWTATNIPGLKARPNWKPGAANKHVVRMYRIARNPEQMLRKKRKKPTGKAKRPLKRPLLIVQKKDGEYIVTMETMRTFNKPRAINQPPYEDKDPLTYTIGRTDEENAERAKRKARAERRLEREQRAFVRSAFHDMCKEICLKTYQQALGIMRYEEDLPCPCDPVNAPHTNPPEIDQSHSCSCTISSRSSGSATDDDEWIIEFTPPNAYFNPALKKTLKKIVKVDNSTQYSYLDYRVKLLDRFGNPVPRFFIGPDGKQQCSDLGGFWGPDKEWLEINEDGIVGVDGRWAPNAFIGPCGEQVDAELGKFQATNGVWLVVGIDGYVDTENKWHFYSKPKKPSKDPRQASNVEQWKKSGGCRPEGDRQKPTFPGKFGGGGAYGAKSETTWSCFGEASPKTLSQRGIFGHGHDRRLLLSTLEKLIAQGEEVSLPPPARISKGKGKVRKPRFLEEVEEYFTERTKCKHHVSERGIEAVNDYGHKTYFKLKNYKNPRPKQRSVALGDQGISLSSFHVPCLSSFISSEEARQRQRDHILQHNARVMANTGAQTGHN